MKLLNKILPATTLVASIPMAMSITSCTSQESNTLDSWHDVLNKYEAQVEAHRKFNIKDKTEEGEGQDFSNTTWFYLRDVKKNPDIFKDDMLYTWSLALNTESSRSQISDYLLDAYDMKVTDIEVNDACTNINFTLRAHLKGSFPEGKEPLYEGNKVQTFEYEIMGRFVNPLTLTYKYQSKEKLEAKDHWFTFKFADTDMIHVRKFGAYYYTDEKTGEHKVHNFDTEELSNKEAVGTEKTTGWPTTRVFLRGSLRFSWLLWDGGTFDWSAWNEIPFYSPYLRNLTIGPRTDQ